MFSSLRERSLCLFNSDGTSIDCQPWSTITDAEFSRDVSSLYKPTNINPIQSIQTDYLPPWISYLWPLVHQGKHVWAVDHPTSKETMSIPFVMKYDLLIWNIFSRFSSISSSIRADLIYPKVLIIVPDWSTCETTLKHLKNVETDLFKKIQMYCIYEGQNCPDDLFRSFVNDGCDLLICTPLILHELIQRRFVHFEQLQMILVKRFVKISCQCVFLYVVRPNRSSRRKCRSSKRIFSTSRTSSKSSNFVGSTHLFFSCC